MGTRATVVVHDEWGGDKPLCCIYKHWDGYTDGLGTDLKEFCEPFSIVNGLTNDEKLVANGMGCLAALLIAHLKDGPGDVYMVPLEQAGEEEYSYHIKHKDGKAVVTCDEEPEWSSAQAAQA